MTPARASSGSALHFRGTPISLSAAARLARPLPPSVSVELDLPDGADVPTTYLADVSATGASEFACVRLHLPWTTPPGTYRGVAGLPDGKREVSVEVAAHVYLRLLPETLPFTAAPGATFETHVTVLNEGNVECSLEPTYAVGLFEVGGMERANALAFRGEGSEKERRIDRWADELAKAHGIARLTLDRAGTLEPGDARDLAVKLAVPKTLSAGRTYSGTWALYNLRHYVRVVVPGGKDRKEIVG